MSLTDYMDRAEEVAKYDQLCRVNGEPATGKGSRAAIEVMAGGDADLFALMWGIWNFEHAFDDLLDESSMDADMKELALTALHDEVVAHTGETVPARNGAAFKSVWLGLMRQSGWQLDRQAQAATARDAFFGLLRFNPIACQYRRELRTLLVQCLIRCHAGDLMAASDNPARRALAPAVRCGDVDLFMHLIYLVRGWAAALTWSALRDYDVDEKTLASP